MSQIINFDWMDSFIKNTWTKEKIESEIELIPFQPSFFISESLLTICKELIDAEGHLLDANLITYFVKCFGDVFVSEVQKFISIFSEFTKEGLVQLWMDVSCMIHFLSNRIIYNDTYFNDLLNIDTTDEDIDIEQMLHWKKKTDSVQREINSKIDPIDKLFYEPRVKKNSKLFFERTKSLYGILLNEKSEDPLSDQSNVPQNVMVMAEIRPRFKLLLIVEDEAVENVVKTPVNSQSTGVVERTKSLFGTFTDFF